MDHTDHSGMWMPTDPPTWARMLAVHVDAWSIVPALTVLVLLAYLVGLVRLRRSGVRWPWWRTASFVLGVVSLLGVTATGFGGYSMVLFSVHMAQHMVLSMISPILLLLGSPVTLALRSLPRGKGAAGTPRALLLELLHSRFARFVSNPGVTLAVFIASLYGVYFTPIFDDLMADPLGHQFMLAHFTATGLLFFGPVIGADPWPRHLSHAGRMGELLIPMPFHAFFGVAIMMANSLVVESFANPPAGWGVDPLADQSTAGAIAWSFGELPTVLVLAVVFFQWAGSEERRGRTIDRTADRTGDAELQAYNARLRTMAEARP